MANKSSKATDILDQTFLEPINVFKTLPDTQKIRFSGETRHNTGILYKLVSHLKLDNSM